MKHWIALLVSFLLTTSAVITDAVVNPVDKIRAGEGNGVSEEIENAEEFGELFANLPTVADYYKAFAPKEEGEEGETSEDSEEAFISDNFKPLTLDTTSYFEYYTRGSEYESKETVYDCTNKNLLPPANSNIAEQYKATTTYYDSNYYELDRKMEIHYFADGVMFSVDAVITSGTIQHDVIKEFKKTGMGIKTYTVGYDEKPIYETDENGEYVYDEHNNKILIADVPDNTSSVDNQGNRRAYSYTNKGEKTQIGSTLYVDTYTLVVKKIKASLYVSNGKVYEKYDNYEIEFPCYEEHRSSPRNKNSSNNEESIIKVVELESPDKDEQSNKTLKNMVGIINRDFKGKWFSLTVEPRDYKGLPEVPQNEEDLASYALAYEKLTEEQKEQMNKMYVQQMMGAQITQLASDCADMMIEIADSSATSYAFFGSYLASVAAENPASSGNKKIFNYSTTYYQGQDRGRDKYMDFALSFLDERGFYDREVYEAEENAFKEWQEGGEEYDPENPEDGYRRTEASRKVYYSTPSGNFTINLISPTAPKLSYKIEGSEDKTNESSKVESVDTEQGTKNYTTYEYNTTSSYKFLIDESITIRNVGNVKAVAPDKVDTDFLDVVYSLMLGETQPNGQED